MKCIALILVTAAALCAADATGTWKGTMLVDPPDGPGQPGPAYLVLKQEGTALTGTIGATAEGQRPFQNGKAENGKLTFELPMGGIASMKFTLEQSGEAITGTMVAEAEGARLSAKLALKREK
jgi:hypothetical protein